MPDKILFVIPSLGGGGAERQMFELVRGLDRKQFSPEVVALVNARHSDIELYSSENVPVIDMRCSGRLGYLIGIFKLRNLISRNNYRLVHGFLNLGTFVGSLGGRLAGIKVFSSSIRDARDKRRLIRLMRSITIRLSDVLTSNSATGFNNRYKKWAPNFDVIHNGIEMKRFASDTETADAIGRELNLDRNKHCVAMVASMTDHKDHAALIDVAQRLNSIRSDIQWLLIGEGPLMGGLQDRVRTLHMEDTFVFAGRRADVDQMWPLVDVSLLLTNWRIIDEGLPNAVLESMASGVPPIATDGGGTVEVVNHGKDGYLVANNDIELISGYLEKLLDDRELNQRLGAAGKDKVASQFGFDQFIERHQAHYRRLLGSGD